VNFADMSKRREKLFYETRGERGKVRDFRLIARVPSFFFGRCHGLLSERRSEAHALTTGTRKLDKHGGL